MNILKLKFPPGEVVAKGREEYNLGPIVTGAFKNYVRTRYANGYGASIIQGTFTYGGPRLAEVTVLRYYSENNHDFHLDMTTPITDDVIGHLNGREVHQILRKIKALGGKHAKVLPLPSE